MKQAKIRLAICCEPCSTDLCKIFRAWVKFELNIQCFFSPVFPFFGVKVLANGENNQVLGILGKYFFCLFQRFFFMIWTIYFLSLTLIFLQKFVQPKVTHFWGNFFSFSNLVCVLKYTNCMYGRNRLKLAGKRWNTLEQAGIHQNRQEYAGLGLNRA